ncbi:MAG TPA: type 4a pilus biogenesis protein PilO [Tepidisphaeraceae bacterium]|nr:type 4a pilus biogenesis protein PilO [Tepidisphaeraceae bacterium]
MKFGLRDMVLVGVLLAMLAGSYVFIFQKMNARRQMLLAETHQEEQTLQNVHQATQGVDDLSRKIGEMQKAIKFFQSRLPAEREVDRILKEVWQMAGANDLKTETVKTLRSDYNADYSEQPIQMTLTGNFDGFYSFLQQLERLDRITRVTQMKLQRIDGANGQMHAELTLSIFFTPSASDDVASIK